MRKSLKFNEKKVTQALVLFCSITFVTLSLIGDKGLFESMALKRQEERLNAEILVLRNEKEEWIRKIHSLKSNQTYMETLAREELGLVKKGEILIKLRFPDAR